jgi:DNA-binding Lrp family transcriptional regulator
MLSAFVLIKAQPSRIPELADALTEVEGVSEVYSVAGEVDLIVVVRVRAHEDLADIVTGHIDALPGIAESRTMVAFRAYSRHDLEALWNIGLENEGDGE